MDTWVVVCVKQLGAIAGTVRKGRKRYMNRKKYCPMYLTLVLHYGIRGGVRNFFYVWCQQALISHLSGCPEPRSKECPLYFSILGPPGPKIDQKWAQMAQKQPKSDFEGSGGPERLERRGTKLERVRGHICWDFQNNWECGGAPNFGPGAPKKGPNGPKTAKI